MTPHQDGDATRPLLPRLHLIVDPALCRERGITPADLAARAVGDGRAVAVHLRAPGLAATALWRLAVGLRAVVVPPALLIVNDRADVAVAVGADGVQLGDRGLPVAAARRVVGARLLLGRSVHGVAAARAAEREGADYALLGTIYPTASHPGAAGGGSALVRAVRASVNLPIIAIGGIDRTTLGAVLGAGANGAAVLRAVGMAADPSGAVAALYRLAHGGYETAGAPSLSDAPTNWRVRRSRSTRTPLPSVNGGDVNGGDIR